MSKSARKSRESRMRKRRNERRKRAEENERKLRSDARSGLKNNFSKAKQFDDIKNRDRFPRLFVEGNLMYVKNGRVGSKIVSENVKRDVYGGGASTALRLLKRILVYQKKHRNYDQVDDVEKWIDRVERYRDGEGRL